jgi:hypothetical protein
VTISNTATRLAAALNLAGVSLSDEDAQSIQERIDRSGVSNAVAYLNEAHDVLLGAGDFIIRSEQEYGFWSNDFGFSYHRDTATGFPREIATDPEQLKQIQMLAPDAQFVLYSEAADFNEAIAPVLEAFEN